MRVLADGVQAHDGLPRSHGVTVLDEPFDDGAAVRRHDLAPIGRILDSQWAGLDPAQMGLGPVHAATPILQRNALKLQDLDYWEINEAFAAQVLEIGRAHV